MNTPESPMVTPDSSEVMPESPTVTSEPTSTPAPRTEGDRLTLPAVTLASEIARHALDRKAHDVLELDMHGLVGYTDYFVICSGNTDRQVKAIHDAVLAGLKHDHGLLPRRVEGVGRAQWVLMDYLDVVVHIFTPATREFYRLEQLWGEAPARSVTDS